MSVSLLFKSASVSSETARELSYVRARIPSIVNISLWVENGSTTLDFPEQQSVASGLPIAPEINADTESHSIIEGLKT